MHLFFILASGSEDQHAMIETPKFLAYIGSFLDPESCLACIPVFRLWHQIYTPCLWNTLTWPGKTPSGSGPSTFSTPPSQNATISGPIPYCPLIEVESVEPTVESSNLEKCTCGSDGSGLVLPTTVLQGALLVGLNNLTSLEFDRSMDEILHDNDVDLPDLHEGIPLLVGVQPWNMSSTSRSFETWIPMKVFIGSGAVATGLDEPELATTRVSWTKGYSGYDPQVHHEYTQTALKRLEFNDDISSEQFPSVIEAFPALKQLSIQDVYGAQTEDLETVVEGRIRFPNVTTVIGVMWAYYFQPIQEALEAIPSLKSLRAAVTGFGNCLSEFRDDEEAYPFNVESTELYQEYKQFRIDRVIAYMTRAVRLDMCGVHDRTLVDIAEVCWMLEHLRLCLDVVCSKKLNQVYVKRSKLKVCVEWGHLLSVEFPLGDRNGFTLDSRDSIS
ncbi:hypothetical protein BGX30_011452 [Mortierella sp. GBA39]|nr:hypothetical protein BGX30_011452 [Mortierella sp. GBA39]